MTGVQAVEPGSIQAEAVSLLLAGALANAAAGVIQFYDRPALLENIVAALHHNPQHNGAYGNIGQANLYANYLALGGTALLILGQAPPSERIAIEPLLGLAKDARRADCR